MELKIEYIPVGKLKPYEKNARKHQEHDLEAIENSIREFGFSDPIGIWGEENTIVEGHGRLMAAKTLGMKEVPCIRLDHMNDEQRRAYCLAHNKTAELSDWDFSMVDFEIADITIDMEQFGFEVKEEKLPAPNERTRTANEYNMDDIDWARITEKYQMPILKPCYHVPKDLMSFNYMLSKDDFEKGIHFYIDDYQFERIWNAPHEYMDRLSKFDCVLTPDFSLYTEMPLPMQIWNIYRSKLIGQIMQDYGMNVIPTLQWCREDSFDYAFDGLPKNSVVSVSTIGVKEDEEAARLWFSGMEEAIKRLQPKCVIVYGGDIGYEFPCEVVFVNNHNTERMKRVK